MKRKYIVGFLVMVVIVVTIGVVKQLAVDLHEKQVLKVTTQDEFGVLLMEAAKYLDGNPNATLSEIRDGLLLRYEQRTGQNVPLDGWGQPILIELTNTPDDKAIHLKFMSAGYDQTWHSPDDVCKEAQLLRVKL